MPSPLLSYGANVVIRLICPSCEEIIDHDHRGEVIRCQHCRAEVEIPVLPPEAARWPRCHDCGQPVNPDDLCRSTVPVARQTSTAVSRLPGLLGSVVNDSTTHATVDLCPCCYEGHRRARGRAIHVDDMIRRAIIAGLVILAIMAVIAIPVAIICNRH